MLKRYCHELYDQAGEQGSKQTNRTAVAGRITAVIQLVCEHIARKDLGCEGCCIHVTTSARSDSKVVSECNLVPCFVFMVVSCDTEGCLHDSRYSRICPIPATCMVFSLYPIVSNRIRMQTVKLFGSAPDGSPTIKETGTCCFGTKTLNERVRHICQGCLLGQKV